MKSYQTIPAPCRVVVKRMPPIRPSSANAGGPKPGNPNTYSSSNANTSFKRKVPVFTDSEEEEDDGDNTPASRPSTAESKPRLSHGQPPVRNLSLSMGRPSTNTGSCLSHQHSSQRTPQYSHPHPPLQPSSHQNHAHQQQQQQRKRVMTMNPPNCPSSAMSSASSSVGGRKPPLSPLAGPCHSSQSMVGGAVGQLNDFDDDYSSGLQVNQMLTKLGADLQLKVRAKKQRLEEYFKNVKAAPASTLASRQRHIEQRNKLVEELRADTTKLAEKLDNIIQVQATNQEKHAKMMLSLTRGSEQVRQAICECAKAQSSLYEKFTSELKKLEDNQDETTKELMERCESTVIELQSRIANEQMKSETESLFKLNFI